MKDSGCDRAVAVDEDKQYAAWADEFLLEEEKMGDFPGNAFAVNNPKP